MSSCVYSSIDWFIILLTKVKKYDDTPNGREVSVYHLLCTEGGYEITLCGVSTISSNELREEDFRKLPVERRCKKCQRILEEDKKRLVRR